MSIIMMGGASGAKDPIENYLVGPEYSKPATEYNSLGLGVIIHQMRDDQVNYGVLDVEAYYTENFDWTALAVQVASLGYVDYIIMRAKNETGFCHWPTAVQFAGGIPFTYNGVTVPQWTDFNITNSHISGLGVTSDTIPRFMAAFANVGIKTGIYYPIGRDQNVRTNMSNTELRNSSDPDIYGRYDQYHIYCRDHIEELMTLYNPEIFWLDNLNHHPWINNSGSDIKRENHEDIYNKMKSINKNIIIMGNLNVEDTGGTLYEGGNIKYFPIDIISQEFASEVPDNEYSDNMTDNGNPYKVPKERLWDGLFNDDNPDVQYDYWDPAAPGAPTNPNQVKTQQDFQDAYDRAITLGATPNFNIGPIPASVGTNKHLIDATYLSRLAGISL